MKPTVSVIIPTYNRSGLLELTLRSLVDQNSHDISVEVLIADDGSSDNTKEVVDSYLSKMSIKYCYQDDEGYRVASARNMAILKADGDILIFVDSGVIVGTHFLQAHVAAHRASMEDIAVIGYILGLAAQVDDPEIITDITVNGIDKTIQTFVSNNRHLDIREPIYKSCGSRLSTLPAPWTLFWTGNVSIKSRCLAQVGMFDTNFNSRWGIEDIELAYRLHIAGVPFVLQRDASSIHFPHPSDSTEKLRQEHDNKLYMHRKHNSIATKALLTSDTVNLNFVLSNRL